MPDEHTSSFVRHAQCPACGSSDALAIHTDGHGFCHSCQTFVPPEGMGSTTTQREAPRKPLAGLADGEPCGLPARKLNEDTCRKWRYLVGKVNGKPAQLATYCDDRGVPVAQKVRYADKTFRWLGQPKLVGLYGQHLWQGGGKILVITEGEIDALTVSQLQENKWPVVSVPNGASAAKKDIAEQIEWVETFERVILMFDMDEPGRKATEEVAALLSPGKAYVASLPCKDANECLQKGHGKDVIDAIWRAKPWRPDEIVAGTDLWSVISDDTAVPTTIPYPWAGLNTLTHGLRAGEITTLCAGSGIGKSSVCREIAHWLLHRGETVGYVALEESIRRTALGILSVETSTPLHLKPDAVSNDDLRKAYDNTVGSGRFFTYDHFGSLESSNLFARLRYMVIGCGCRWIVLDHVSIVVSGITDGDERRTIDNIMTTLRSMVEELGFGLVLVSHLKETEGKSLEEGGRTHLNLLRGSRSIGQLSDTVLGLERDQQDPEAKCLTTIRVLKNRFSGDTGVATTLVYDVDTGRLKEQEGPSFPPVTSDSEEEPTGF